MKVGVLAVQGNFREHAAMLRRLGAEVSRHRQVGARRPEVEVLAELDGEPVLLREGRFLVASFHPELTEDTRVHERFLEMVREETDVRA